MERGVQVRVARKPFRFDDRRFARGSVVITTLDNRDFPGSLETTVDQTANELRLDGPRHPLGLGEGDLPDLGGEYFVRLEPPRIALLGRGSFNTTDYGATWYVLDTIWGFATRTSRKAADSISRVIM